MFIIFRRMKEATSDFHTAFELNAGIAQTFIQVRVIEIIILACFGVKFSAKI